MDRIAEGVKLSGETRRETCGRGSRDRDRGGYVVADSVHKKFSRIEGFLCDKVPL